MTAARTSRTPHAWFVVAGALVAAGLAIALPAGAQAQPLDEAETSHAPEGQIQQDTQEETIRSRKDTFVASSRADANFGGDSQLFVGQPTQYGAARLLVEFSLDDLEPKYVVVGGTLRLYMRSGGPIGDATRDIVVYRLTGDWSEGEATWNNFPSWDNDRLDTVALGTAGGWYNWDIDDLARDWYLEEVDNRGLYVQGYEANGSYRSFDSREGSQRPELRLEVKIDDKPPLAMLDKLPPYLASSDVPLTWLKGTDPEPSSGVVSYEVWFRKDTGQWQLAAKDIKGLTYTFRNAENGRTYYFQVLAVDRAGNRQPLGVEQASTLIDYSAPSARLEALPTWSPGDITLRPTGEDLPNTPGLSNSGLSHFDIDYRIGGGAWAPLAYSHPNGIPYVYAAPPDGASLQFRLRGVDNAGNLGVFTDVAASTTADRTAPEAWFYYTNPVDAPTFRVSWGGDDATSGLDSFDVEVQVGTTAWQTWLTGTRDRYKDYAGEYGRTYGFRIRARDNAGNEGAWPGGAQLVVVPVESSRLIEHIFLPSVTDPSPAPPRSGARAW